MAETVKNLLMSEGMVHVSPLLVLGLLILLVVIALVLVVGSRRLPAITFPLWTVQSD